MPKIERNGELTVWMSIDPSPSRNEDIICMDRNVLKKAAGYIDIYLLRLMGNQRKWVEYVLSCNESNPLGSVIVDSKNEIYENRR